MLGVPVAALAGRLDLAGVALALAAMSALTVIFDVADHAFLPQLIERAQLVDGNAKLAATDAAGEVGGPAVAGVLFQVFSAPLAIAVSALTYLASAFCLLFVRAPKSMSAAPAEPLRFDVAAGFSVVLAHPIVRPIWLMALGRDFFGWFFGALYTLFGLEVLRLSTAELGLTIAAGGVGALAGAWLAPLVSRRVGAGAAIVAASLLAGATAALVPLAGGPPLAAMATLIVAQLGGDAIGSVRDIAQASLRQAVLPPEALGRTAGAFATGQGLAGVAGALTGGALGSAIGPRETLYLAAAGLFLTGLIGLASPLRSARQS
jgi:predicted MFS family arabinose efflux permease